MGLIGIIWSPPPPSFLCFLGDLSSWKIKLKTNISNQFPDEKYAGYRFLKIFLCRRWIKHCLRHTSTDITTTSSFGRHFVKYDISINIIKIATYQSLLRGCSQDVIATAIYLSQIIAIAPCEQPLPIDLNIVNRIFCRFIQYLYLRAFLTIFVQCLSNW